MASIHEEVLIEAAPDVAWDAVRDVGAPHTRLVPGFVARTELVAGASPEVRVVTFASGLVLREVIVDRDDARRRIVWTAESERLTHHNGALQVFDAGGGRSRAVWTADILPHEARAAIQGLMRQGLAAMKRRLDAPPPG